MARFSKLLYIAGILAAASFTACTNDGDIGDLYGKWQLTGTEQYLNFEGKICQMQIVKADSHEIASVWCGFSYTADSLHINVATADYVAGTTAVDGLNTTELLKVFFRFELPENSKLHFGYSINDKQLILTQKENNWTFRHYGF